MPSSSPAYWTRDLVRALPDDGRRHELVYGELLVTPSPSMPHQRILRRLTTLLDAWLQSNPVGELFTAPADLSWGPDTLVQPDLFVVPFRDPYPTRWEEVRDLLLVIEILSPSTARHDRFQKRRRYQEAGVPLYWIVDPDERRVEVWTPADRFPQIERERAAWRPEGIGEAFVLELQELFKGS